MRIEEWSFNNNVVRYFNENQLTKQVGWFLKRVYNNFSSIDEFDDSDLSKLITDNKEYFDLGIFGKTVVWSHYL